jgi:outer membrane protein TolC
MILDINTIQQMLVKNLEVKIREVEINEQKSFAQTFGSSFIPRLYLYQGFQSERGDEKKSFSGSGVGVELNLYHGGKDYYFSKASSASAEKLNYDKQIKLQELTTRAQDAYLDLLKNDELRKIYLNYENSNTQNITLVTRKVKSGLIHENELLGFKLVAIEIGDELQMLLRERQKSIIDLSSILGVNLTEVETSTVDFEKVDLHNNFPEKTYELSLKSFFQTTQQLEWSKKSMGLFSGMHAALFSELSFTKNNLGDYLPEDNNASKVFGVKVTWDLLDANNERNLEAKRKAFEMEKESLNQLKWKTEYDVTNKKANVDLVMTEEKIKYLLAKLDIGQKIFSTTIEGFKKGLKDAGDLSEHLEKLIHAKKELVEYKIKRLKLLNELNR